MNNLIERAGTPDIACSALLGVFVIPSIRDAWDKYLLILATLAMLCVCIKILWEEYAPDFDSEQRQSKECQKPSEINNASGGNLCKLCRCHKYLRLHLGNLGHRVLLCGAYLRNGFLKCINPCLKFLGFAHKRMTPNEKS